MTIYYHVDRYEKLKSGDLIQLDGIQYSKFGEQYNYSFQKARLFDFRLENPLTAYLNTPEYREYFLETFRTSDPDQDNSNTFSRLKSFFAVESIEDCNRLINRMSHRGEVKIFEVRSNSSARKYDMSWLDFSFPRDFREFGYYYRAYWSGKLLNDDQYLSAYIKNERASLIEVLLQGEITIGSEIKP